VIGKYNMQKLPYREFGNQYIKKEIFIIIPILLLFVLLAFSSTNNPLIKWTLVALLLLVSTIGTIWQTKRLKTFVCPNCKNKISEPTIKYRKENDPINYYCSNCDIEWETGLTEGGFDT
jgi:predicted RNA-binding Zn-ribbon protein involved in translation (DUF1610 family)